MKKATAQHRPAPIIAHRASGVCAIRPLFTANIVFHALWSPLFFNLRRPDWALIEAPFLWLSILGLIVGLAPLDPLAGLLLAPYLLWVSFAALLNLTIVRLNPPFGARPA